MFGAEGHIRSALESIRKAQEQLPSVDDGVARLVIADRHLRGLLDALVRRRERLAGLATDAGRCERGVYINS